MCDPQQPDPESSSAVAMEAVQRAAQTAQSAPVPELYQPRTTPHPVTFYQPRLNAEGIHLRYLPQIARWSTDLPVDCGASIDAVPQELSPQDGGARWQQADPVPPQRQQQRAALGLEDKPQRPCHSQQVVRPLGVVIIAP
jgi:hypothetical protein